jgi:GNAT superfamily N-acetyltransferase
MMVSVDPGIRLVEPHEFDRVGDIVVDAYSALGDLGAYEAVLRDVADRLSERGGCRRRGQRRDRGHGHVRRQGGTLCGERRPDASWIRMLAVDPASAGRASARALVEWCVARARVSPAAHGWSFTPPIR